MKILGVVAEYDPFHNGHLFHLTEAKKQISPDLVYIVLSPCVKQRGGLSLLSPLDRARCALEAGALFANHLSKEIFVALGKTRRKGCLTLNSL